MLKPPASLLTLHARQTPEAVALQYAGTDYTYAQLEQMVLRVCGSLLGAGLQPGQTLACLDDDRLVTGLLLFAAPRLGCRLLPLNPALPHSLASELLHLSRADLLIADDTSLQLDVPLESSSELLTAALDESGDLEPIEDSALEINETHLLIATSGTEGTPRLVMLSGSNLMASVVASRKRIPLSLSSSWLLCMPLFHIGGLSVLLRCFEAGAMVVLHGGFDVDRVIEALDMQAITHLSLVPTMLARIRQTDKHLAPPDTLQAVLLGGDALDSALEQWAEVHRWPLCPTYGLTEASSQVATRFPPVWNREPGNVGHALDHMEICIEEGSGRVMIRGQGMMQGYLEADGRCNLPLVDGWFATGDLGQVNERGELIILGRFGDIFISGGENIHPGMIENQLRMIEGITDVAVTAFSDPEWGDKLVALYVGEADECVVEDWAKRHLEGAMRPKLYRKIAAIPCNDNGKIQRDLLINEWLK